MVFPLGAHVDSVNPLAEAEAIGAGVVQIFLGDPQSWKKPATLYPEGAEALEQAAQAARVQLVIHAPYVLNVASLNNRVRIPSRKLLQQTVDEAAAVGALGVVVHGGDVTAKDDPAVGFDNWRKCVDGLKLPVPIFIENTAGGGHAMARHEEAIERLWTAISTSENFGQVGFCLDTCHAHAGGLELDGLVGRIKAITGRIDVVHCNDSRDAAGSGADRHANLGQGFADADALVAVVRDAAAPTVLETPGGALEHLQDLAWLSERL
ncbi:deoxyribonuclease IV [Tessaracoccus massiliensis]|uniref:deoxyribonuclease IV n=1 Tax=Tessaracoccus massiliensis TaxID=1522311 RepID=UPI00058E71CF|nr:deoxyribonuclease IV [Tessaracoccus massiliensis]